MKKMSILLVTLMACLCAISCSHEDAVGHYSPESVSVDADGGEVYLTLTGVGGTWALSSDVDWITIPQSHFEGNANAMIKVKPNKSNYERSAWVNVEFYNKSGGMSGGSVKITQSGSDDGNSSNEEDNTGDKDNNTNGENNDGEEDNNSGGNNDSDGNDGTTLAAPTNLDAWQEGHIIYFMWDEVTGADYYNAYYSWDSRSFTELGSTYANYISIDMSQVDNPSTLYLKVEATKGNQRGTMSNIISVDYLPEDPDGNDNTGNGNQDNNNQGGDNNNGDDYGGGSNNGGNQGGGNNDVAKPSAPTGLSAEYTGSVYLPEITVSWNEVANATSYKLYRSSSASGTYSQIGAETTCTFQYDPNPLSGKNYYKVKAINSAGESGYSNYVVYSYDSTEGKVPGTPQVTVTGTSTITIKWTCPTGNGYGKPTEYDLYKRDPNTGDFYVLTTTTKTSYTDTNPHPGYNRYAVIAKNENGESGSGMEMSDEVPLSTPTSFSATLSGKEYVKFTWKKVPGATGYQIFTCPSANGNYIIQDQIDDGDATSHTMYYPASGTVYFKIKAFWEAEYGGSPIYSNLSTYKSVTF